MERIQEATIAFEVPDTQEDMLEGLCFDRQGNLYFVGAVSGLLFKADVDTGEVKTIFTAPEGYGPTAIKIHQDGRLFVTCPGDLKKNGCIFTIQPDGSNFQMILPPVAGYLIDDMVFRHDGSFYFTDFKGTPWHPTGGIYYVSEDGQHIQPVIQGLAMPNGIALTPDEHALWITKTCGGRLFYVELEEDHVHIPPFGAFVCHYFEGMSGPDSCCIDAEGNLYVALFEQGAYLIFDLQGRVLERIEVPGCHEHQYMKSAHPAIRPGTSELYLSASDGNGRGCRIVKAKARAKAYRSYQY